MIHDGCKYDPQAVSIRMSQLMDNLSVTTRADFCTAWAALTPLEREWYRDMMIFGAVTFPDEFRLNPYDIAAGTFTAISRVSGSFQPIIKFAGTLSGLLVGTVTRYLGDDQSAELSAAPGYPIAARSFSALRYKARVNSLGTNATVTVMKNGVATALTVTVTAGSTAVFSLLGTGVDFAVDDTIDVQVTNTNGGLATQLIGSATVEAYR